MKILYVFHLDPEDPNVQSGRPFSILQQMRANGHQVDILTFNQRFWMKPYLRKFLAALWGKRYGSEVSALEVWAYTLAINRRIRRAKEPYDIIFSPSIRPFVSLQTTAYTVACNDTLFADLSDTYPQFEHDDPGYTRRGIDQEARALANIDLTILPTHHSIELAKKRYNVPDERLHHAMFGSNLGWHPSSQQVECSIEQRLARNEINFLMIAVDWLRKGGDFVVKTAEVLAQRGISTRVDVVGLDRPDDISQHCNSSVRFHGRMPLRTEEGARRLFDLSTRSTFFFVPSLAEAYGMAFVEAAACGLPLIGSDVGGISDIIEPGMGLKLNLSANPSDAADWVQGVYGNPETYRAMAHRAHAASLNRLNWSVFWSSCEHRISTHLLTRLEPS